MTDVVSILFVKLVSVHFLAEFALPEMETLFKAEANSFQEETILQSSIMLKMMIVSNCAMKTEHAGWIVLTSKKVNVLQVYFPMMSFLARGILKIDKIFL